MATATYDSVLDQAQQLSPEDQARLMEALEELADMRAYDAAVAAQADEDLVPLDQAITSNATTTA